MLDAELSIQSGMPAPFHAYQLDDAYDEMFTPAGRAARPVRVSLSGGCWN